MGACGVVVIFRGAAVIIVGGTSGAGGFRAGVIKRQC